MLSQMRRLAPLGRHYAFEPIPNKATALARKFSNVSVMALAISDRPGVATFRYVTRDSANSGLEWATDTYTDSAKIEVKTERLDAVLPAEHRVDFIKIDVEGAELAVLRGAERTIRVHRPRILFECIDGAAKRYGATTEQVYDLLVGSGMSVCMLNAWLDGGTLMSRVEFIAATQPPSGAPAAYNFLAVPAN